MTTLENGKVVFTFAADDGSFQGVYQRTVTFAGTIEGAANGTVVGSVSSVTDPDIGDTHTYTLTDDAGGRFAINNTTGDITVANSYLLDYESATSYTVTVRVTDAGGLTYDEVVTINLTDVVEQNSAPTDLSNGVELNTDGGNDAYLVASQPTLDGLSSLTYEISFAFSDPPVVSSAIASYATASDANEFMLEILNDGTLAMHVNGGTTTTVPMPALFDGKQHHIAVSWDNTNGDVAIYVDGQFIRSKTGISQGFTLGTGTFVIGNDQDSVGGGFNPDEAFHGTLYDVRVWDNVRSAEEISLNYQQILDLTPAEATAMGIVANWQMKDLVGGTTVVDLVNPGTNDLTLASAGTSGGWIASTPSDTLSVDENAATNTVVGSVVPSDPDTFNDVSTDGHFRESGITTSWQQYDAPDTFGDWSVDAGTIAVGTISSYQLPPGGGNMVNLNLHSAYDAGVISTIAGHGSWQAVSNRLSPSPATGAAIPTPRTSGSLQMELHKTFQYRDELRLGLQPDVLGSSEAFTFTATSIDDHAQLCIARWKHHRRSRHRRHVRVVEIPCSHSNDSQQ